MSRVEDRVAKRACAVRLEARHADDVARYWRAEAERARVATRLRVLSEKVRTGPYAGRAVDLEEIDRLWSGVARVTR